MAGRCQAVVLRHRWRATALAGGASLVRLCLYDGGGGVAAPGLAAMASLLEVVGQVATSCGGSRDLTPSLDCEWRRHCR
jgi:hypothetical protein